jgi:signal transduction histidine kinase
VQEALTNVVRHAQATQVQVSIRLADNTLHLTVQDDGIGISDGQGGGHPNSHGLKIMRERAEAFGGSVIIKPASGRGTWLEASIPIQSSAAVTR